jgi:hypothetical protein
MKPFFKTRPPNRGTPEALAAGCNCGGATSVWPYGYSSACDVHRGEWQALIAAMRISRREGEELLPDYE